MRLMSVTVCVCCAALSAAESRGTPGEALVTEFRAVLKHIFELQKTDRRLPHDITPQQIDQRIELAVENMKKAGLFDVTPEQQKRFAEDRFDDTANTARLKNALKELHESGVDLPVTTVFAGRELEAGNLRGVRLELCARMVEYNLAQLKNEAKP